jgi:hypothetical protein
MERFRLEIRGSNALEPIDTIEFNSAEILTWDAEGHEREDLIEDLLTAPVGYSTIEGGGASPIFQYTRIA